MGSPRRENPSCPLGDPRDHTRSSVENGHRSKVGLRRLIAFGLEAGGACHGKMTYPHHQVIFELDIWEARVNPKGCPSPGETLLSLLKEASQNRLEALKATGTAGQSIGPILGYWFSMIFL